MRKEFKITFMATRNTCCYKTTISITKIRLIVIILLQCRQCRLKNRRMMKVPTGRTQAHTTTDLALPWIDLTGEVKNLFELNALDKRGKKGKGYKHTRGCLFPYKSNGEDNSQQFRHTFRLCWH